MLQQSAKILRGPGTLLVNPTLAGGIDPSGYPWGGEVLGNVQDVYLTPFDSGFTTWAEEFGEPADQLEALRDWGVGAFLRGWDDDVLQTVFPNTSTGPVSQHPIVTIHGSREPGESAYDARKVVLMFAPFNPKDVPSFVAYAAVPLVEEAARLSFVWGDDLGVPVLFRMFRDSAGDIATIARMSDL